MKIVNIFFTSGKQLAISVDGEERERLIQWLDSTNINSERFYTIKQGSQTYSIYKDKIEYSVY
ncbi:hypothetical protein [Clostridium sp. DJ247]|uniref:hypothetical protein n=1 Tax=Clostridium sp. DJ247 TaxID=2726188 RepID=UPI001626141F|nr:hypothetical protein [Clostridium sp. DJ247]MBC2579976.1 hypothetical protein [Clostridium sp. DJ247]